MKTIAYYISDYGYGHASRSIAVIRELLREPDVRIIICHSYALPFIKSSITDDRVTFRWVNTDIGYFLKKDSIFPDQSLLFQEYKNYLSYWKNGIQKEQDFLKRNNIGLVVSDISPLAFEAAENLRIPSIGLSNFTWYTAYQGLMDARELRPLKEAYQKMDYFFSLAGSHENWNINTKKYGFFSREIKQKEIDRIKQSVNPTGKNNVVFLGLGMKIDVESLEGLLIWDSPNTSFIVSSNFHVKRENVYQIPNEYNETQNYIAAADLVISKAGWGMIGEALSSNTPLLILDRPSMKEDQNTISYLKERYLCKTINWEEFKLFQVNSTYIKELQESTDVRDIHYGYEASKIAGDIIKILNKG